MEAFEGSLVPAETFEVEARAVRIGRLLEAIGYPVAWVSDRSMLRDFVNDVTGREELVERVRRAYGVRRTSSASFGSSSTNSSDVRGHDRVREPRQT